jgi:UDP:flavonoid glycosyltransferase YjiC (YdhE family)
MRILFTCVAGYGHFHPLVPLARALADQEHDVAFATSSAFRERIQASGFRFFEAGLSQDEVDERFAPYRARLGALPIPERRQHVYRWRWAEIDSPARLRTLREAATAWQPELMIHESAELAAPLVAASLGLPSVNHSFGRMVPRACLEGAAESLEPVWRAEGVEPEPHCGVFRGLYVDICPPSFQTEAPPVGARIQPLRPLFPPAPGESPPEWLDELRDTPMVYVTLGTVHNDLTLFRTLLAALADVDCSVVATIGPTNDPETLGPLPANARVERYVAQAFLLHECDVVVAQGGSGSTLAALAHGVPSLLIPQGADQFENAERCASLGAGLALLPDAVTVESVHAAVVELLRAPSYRFSARRMAGEIESMPHPTDAAPAIVRESVLQN